MAQHLSQYREKVQGFVAAFSGLPSDEASSSNSVSIVSGRKTTAPSVPPKATEPPAKRAKESAGDTSHRANAICPFRGCLRFQGLRWDRVPKEHVCVHMGDAIDDVFLQTKGGPLAGVSRLPDGEEAKAVFAQMCAHVKARQMKKSSRGKKPTPLTWDEVFDRL